MHSYVFMYPTVCSTAAAVNVAEARTLSYLVIPPNIVLAVDIQVFFFSFGLVFGYLMCCACRIPPFRAPEPLPTLNPSNFVPKNGFPVVKGLIRRVHVLPSE